MKGPGSMLGRPRGLEKQQGEDLGQKSMLREQTFCLGYLDDDGPIGLEEDAEFGVLLLNRSEKRRSWSELLSECPSWFRREFKTVWKSV